VCVTYRRDEGARSGQLSDDGRNAEVPHTTTESSYSSGDDNAVVPAGLSQSNSQQNQPIVIFAIIKCACLYIYSYCLICVYITSTSKISLLLQEAKAISEAKQGFF